MSSADIQIGKHVFYSSVGICIVTDKVVMDDNEYFVLKTIDKKNESTLYIPVNNVELMKKICNIVSKKEILNCIDKSKKENMSWNENRRERQEQFLSILRTDDYIKILTMIRCLYLRNDELKKENKRLSTCDNDILLKAKFIIEQIFAYVHNIDIIDAKEALEKHFIII